MMFIGKGERETKDKNERVKTIELVNVYLWFLPTRSGDQYELSQLESDRGIMPISPLKVPGRFNP